MGCWIASRALFLSFFVNFCLQLSIVMLLRFALRRSISNDVCNVLHHRSLSGVGRRLRALHPSTLLPLPSRRASSSSFEIIALLAVATRLTPVEVVGDSPTWMRVHLVGPQGTYTIAILGSRECWGDGGVLSQLLWRMTT